MAFIQIPAVKLSMINLKLFILLLFFTAMPSWADWKEEEIKINYLISEIEHINGVFIRNGDEHSPQEAAAHIRMKMEKAMNSWFAPEKERWTAEMFIDNIASKSSISGKPYRIKLDGGEILNAGDWLYQKLEFFLQNR